MTRQHGTMHNRFRVEAAIDGQHSHAVLIPPQQPTRRRSPDLSAYDRLDPPRPVRPTRYGRSRISDVEGMDRLRQALDDLGAKMKAASHDALLQAAAQAQREARGDLGARLARDQAFWDGRARVYKRGPARPLINDKP